jgi:MFS family permease
MFIGMWMSLFPFSTILGRLIMGAFMSKMTWRWWFWINLPVGGPIIVLVPPSFKAAKHVKHPLTSWDRDILQLYSPARFAYFASYWRCRGVGGQTKVWVSVVGLEEVRFRKASTCACATDLDGKYP